MCPIRTALRPFVLAAALLLVGAAVAEANPRPPVVIYPQVQPFTPGVRIAPNVYMYPQFNSGPSYLYPNYLYPGYSYPYSMPYNNSYYYNTWMTPSLYPSYPYYSGYYNNYNYRYYYRIR